MSPGRLTAVGGVLAGAILLCLVAFRGGPRPPEPAAAPAGPPEEATVAVEPIPAPAATGPEGTPFAEGAAVRGRAVRREGKGCYVPVAAVAVRLVDERDRTLPALRETSTNATGRFEIAGISAEGTYVVEIEAPGSVLIAYRFKPGNLRGPGRRLDLGDLVIAPGIELEVRVLGAGGEPLTDAEVSATGLGDPRLVSVSGIPYLDGLPLSLPPAARPVGNGVYAFDRLWTGGHSLFVCAPRHRSASRAMELPAPGPIEIRLEAGLRIAGVVLSTASEPIAGAGVAISGAGEERTDASGRFLFDTLGPGTYTVWAEAEGHVRAMVEEIPAGTEDLEVVLADEAVFSGSVVSEEGGRPIAGATVTLSSGDPDDFSATTDGAGRFAVRALPAGNYLVKVEHPEFATLREGFRDLAEGQQIGDQEIRLPVGLTARGTVVDGESGEAVAGAQVELSSYEEDLRPAGVVRAGKTVLSEEDGRFTVNGLIAGKYYLEASAPGYSEEREPVPVEAEVEDPIEVRLRRAGTISGRVLDPEGMPVLGAVVWWDIEEGIADLPEGKDIPRGSRGGVRTDADGRYRLEGVGRTPVYWVFAAHADYARGLAAPAPTGPGDDVDIVLARGGSLSGRVVDGSSQPIHGAEVRLSRKDVLTFMRSRRVYSWLTADHDGAYAFLLLNAGSYSVEASAAGFVSREVEGIVVAEAGAARASDLVLARGERVTGRVIDDQGNPVAGAAIGGSSSREEMLSDEAGRFALDGVEPGTAYLHVEKEGHQYTQLDVLVPGPEVTLRVPRLARLRGEVQAAGKEEFATFEAMAIRQDGEWSFLDKDAEGGFSASLEAGTYVVHVLVPGCLPGQSGEVTLRAGEVREDLVIEVAEGHRVSGAVIARASGEPVAGAEVEARAAGFLTADAAWKSPFATTGRDGAFVVDGLPRGPCTLVVTHESFAHRVVHGNADPGTPASLRIELDPGGGVAVTVTSAGEPVKDAEVTVWRNEQGTLIRRSAETGSAGRAEVRGLAAGAYFVDAAWRPRGADSRVEERRQATVRAGAVAELVIAASAPAAGESQGRHRAGRGEGAVVPRGRIAGTVVDATSGAPLRDASVFVLEAGVNLKTVAAWSRALAEETATNGDGRFSLEAAPGTCSLQGAAPGYAEARVDGIEVAAGEVLTEVRVALEPAGKCRLQVLDRQGHALAKARAFVLDSQGGLVRPDPSRESSFDGTILLSGLRPGSYQAVVVHPAWAPARAPLEATLSGSRAVVRLEEGGGLSIAITDRLGAAVEGAEVAIRDEHGIDFLDLALAGGAVLGGAPPARSDREGRLPSLRLPAGHYRIAVDPRAPPEGRRPLEQPVEVTAGREETLRIVIGDDGPQDADGTRGN